MINEQQFRVVRTKSIQNVDSDRLRDSLSQVHSMVHTADGLHAWDQPRRGLIDNGKKAMLIRDELKKRGESSGIDCRWCGT
jgi:hypothetical protein